MQVLTTTPALTVTPALPAPGTPDIHPVNPDLQAYAADFTKLGATGMAMRGDAVELYFNGPADARAAQAILRPELPLGDGRVRVEVAWPEGDGNGGAAPVDPTVVTDRLAKLDGVTGVQHLGGLGLYHVTTRDEATAAHLRVLVNDEIAGDLVTIAPEAFVTIPR